MLTYLNVKNKFSARVIYRTPAKLSTSLETRKDAEYKTTLKYLNNIFLNAIPYMDLFITVTIYRHNTDNVCTDTHSWTRLVILA